MHWESDPTACSVSTECNVTFHLKYAFQYCGPDYPGTYASYLPCTRVPQCCIEAGNGCPAQNSRGYAHPDCGEVLPSDLDLDFGNIQLGDGTILFGVTGQFLSFSESDSYAVFEKTFTHTYTSAEGFSCTAQNANQPPCTYTVRGANRERPDGCQEIAYSDTAAAFESFNCQVNNFRASYGVEVTVTNLAISSGSPEVTMFPIQQIYRNQPQPVTIDIPTADASGQQVQFSWFDGISFDAGPIRFDANLNNLQEWIEGPVSAYYGSQSPAQTRSRYLYVNNAQYIGPADSVRDGRIVWDVGQGTLETLELDTRITFCFCFFLHTLLIKQVYVRQTI